MSGKGVAFTAAFVEKSRIRSRLIELLSNRPRTPTELASIERKHVSHVSRALAELRERGLVEAISTESRERYYRTTYLGLAIYYSMVRTPK
jgi:DNA-binding transcriptional ArsR family regulator